MILLNDGYTLKAAGSLVVGDTIIVLINGKEVTAEVTAIKGETKSTLLVFLEGYFVPFRMRKEQSVEVKNGRN